MLQKANYCSKALNKEMLAIFVISIKGNFSHTNINARHFTGMNMY